MNLRQCISNCLNFPECEKSCFNVVNVLGLLWNQSDDTFNIPGGDKISKSGKTTKHDVLHNVSESLPTELLMEWHLIVDQLSGISDFDIP